MSHFNILFTAEEQSHSQMGGTTVTPNQLVRAKKNSPYLFILVVGGVRSLELQDVGEGVGALDATSLPLHLTLPLLRLVHTHR